MISSLIAILRRIQLEPTAEEVADALWLAIHIGQPRLGQAKEAEISHETHQRQDEVTPKQEELSPQQPRSNVAESTTPASTSSVYTYPLQSSGSIRKGSGITFRTPAAFALPGSLILARALRPLMRRVPSRTTSVFDEEATAQQIAEEGIWMPMLRPAAERWFEVALVVDTSASMIVWRQTIAEMQLLLERHGAFRDVRTWSLITSVGKVLKEDLLPSGMYLVDAAGRARRSGELVDPAGRRLILIITDCVSPAWQNGTAAQLLATWGRTNPLAIVQVLPQRLWSQTALGTAKAVRVSAPIPGVPNAQLKVEPLRRWANKKYSLGIPIPITTLEPTPLIAWAKLVAGLGGTWTPAFILAASAMGSERNEMQAIPVSPEQRVQRFQATASSLAFELAGLLAAAPLRLPVMRLVQQTMLPQSRQVHLAEVFLGGVLKQVSSDEATSNPDFLQYDFVEGVRDLLLDTLPVPDAVRVLKEVSSAIESRLGQTLDFQAILADPTVKDGIAIEEMDQPFANVASKVLRRLGGRYTHIAEQLERGKDNGFSSEKSSPVLRLLVVDIPQVVNLGDSFSILVSLTASSASETAASLAISLPIGATADIVVQAGQGFALEGQGEGSLVITDAQEILPLQFKLRSIALEPGQIRVEVLHKGDPIGAMTLTPVVTKRFADTPTASPRSPDQPMTPVSIRSLDQEVSIINLSESDWNRLLRRIKEGRCTPFLGPGASAGVIPLGSQIARQWAQEYNYPLDDSFDLAKVAQYVAVTEDSMVPKDKIQELFQALPLPDFSFPDEPYRVLADLPFPIYMTTNYDNLMVSALTMQQKAPKMEICRWNSFLRKNVISIFDADPNYTPTPSNPLVFHLNGHIKVPESLVLTEDDYLDFQINISKDENLLPTRIRRAMTSSTLLFLGYRIADWDWRILIRSIVGYLEKSLARVHVAVMIAPEHEGMMREQQEKEQKYLENYLAKLDIRAYWGSCREFAAELRSRWVEYNNGN